LCAQDDVNVRVTGRLERQVITHHYRKVYRVYQSQVGCNIVQRLPGFRVDHDKERGVSIKARTHHASKMIMVRAGPDNQHIHVGNGFVSQDQLQARPGSGLKTFRLTEERSDGVICKATQDGFA
jgi:hypothetical protein